MKASAASKALPAWAEDVLRRFGPQPARAADRPDPVALAKYTAMTERFRRRWAAELAPDVWSLFASDAEHRQQRQHLLGAMIDLAGYGSHAEMLAKRDALAEVERIDDELRALAHAVRNKVHLRSELTRSHLIASGLDDDLVEAFGGAADAVAMQSWSEPALENVDVREAISSRKSTADAVNTMLVALDRIAPLLLPVQLTDAARASIFNVAHDVDAEENRSPEAIKTARARLRRR